MNCPKKDTNDESIRQHFLSAVINMRNSHVYVPLYIKNTFFFLFFFFKSSSLLSSSSTLAVNINFHPIKHARVRSNP